MLVSGRSSQHHRYNWQNVEGSSLHLWLGKCLLIPAKMPGCFLVHIPHYTSAPHRSIIQEESCGYLMLCCRAVFFPPCAFSYSAFIPLSSFASPSFLHLVLCGTSYPLALCFFPKKKKPKLCGSADEGSFFMLQVILQYWAAIAGSPALSSLHVCIINCLGYQLQLFGPCRHPALST